MKNSVARLWLFLFLASTAAHLLSLQGDSLAFRLISKALLMPLLGVYAYTQESYISPRLKRSLLLALACCWVGDVLLALPGNYFLPGLLAFLLAHLVYVVAYGYASGNYPLKNIWKRWWYWLPILGYGSSFAAWLLPQLQGGLQLAVGGYALVLVVMLLAAAGRDKYTHPTSFVLVLVGAGLFVLSDSLIAINRFVDPLPRPGFYIMLTYCLGQWLIVEGLLRHPSPVRHY